VGTKENDLFGMNGLYDFLRGLPNLFFGDRQPVKARRGVFRLGFAHRSPPFQIAWGVLLFHFADSSR
jgi:hypothetical protein